MTTNRRFTVKPPCDSTSSGSAPAQVAGKNACSVAGTTRPEAFSNRRLLRRLFALAWRYRGKCLVVVAQQALVMALQMGVLAVTGLAIDWICYRASAAGTPPRWPLGWAPAPDLSSMGVVGLLAAMVLLLALPCTAMRYAATITSSRLVQEIVIDLRSAVYDRFQRLSFRYFDAGSSGSLIQRVAGDVQSVRMFVDAVLVQVLVVVLSLVLYLVYMFRIHLPLTLACLATTPILWMAAVLFSRKVRPEYVRHSELVDGLLLALSENVQGMHIVKGFALEERQIKRFRDQTSAVYAQKENIFRLVSLLQPLMGLLTQVNMVILLGFGGYLVARGELRLGEGLFVFANLLHQFANQVGQVTNIANSIQQSLVGAERVFQVLDAPVEIADPPEPEWVGRVQGAIRMEDVSFSYEQGKPVLHDIQLAVRPGECVAVVGATGSGKTTLLSLIPRFYDVSAGRVLVDGIDVRRMRLRDLRRNIGMVFQESFLFSNTAASNISYGNPSAAAAEIESASRTAAAHDFVNGLPQGYDTPVGEYGANLSGGQRQRLAIARALLVDPPVLLLDDATTAVDAETEHEIAQAMETAMRGRTTLVIAHRLSTVRRADRVLVLDQGRIVQQGTHEELMRQPGHYREAVLLQLEKDGTPDVTRPSDRMAI